MSKQYEGLMYALKTDLESASMKLGKVKWGGSMPGTVQIKAEDITLENFIRQFCNRMISTATAKNADYTGATNDPLSNFRLVEQVGITSLEIGLFTRMLDKVARISTFIKTGVFRVATEKIEDTLLDLATYCAIMAFYLQSKRGEK